MFSKHPGCEINYENKIDMKDKNPFCSPSYHVPFIHRRKIHHQIKEMTDFDIIKAEETEYISPLPLVTVRKKDKSIRICLDAQMLNERLNKDFIMSPNSSELLYSFKQGQIFSTIDLTAAYWQLPIWRKDQKFFGFMFEGLSYTINRVPFGLSTSIASLIRCLKTILCDFNYTGCVILIVGCKYLEK